MPRTAGRILVAASCAALAAAAGCYEHVVSAKGPGADRYDLHEPNIGRDESVWATPGARPKDETYGMRPGGDAPGQTRPASNDD